MAFELVSAQPDQVLSRPDYVRPQHDRNNHFLC